MMRRKIFHKTPLAWLQISRERTRLWVAIAGIAFADLLMFVQLGVRDALFDSQSLTYTKLQGDLFVVSTLSDNFASLKSFSRDNLYRSGGINGVQSVTSLYTNLGTWRNPETQTSRQIFVYGIDPDQPALNLSGVNQNLDKLKQFNQVLFDEAGGLSKLGDMPTLLKHQNPLPVQVNDLQVQVIGLFTLGSSFAAEGNLITSDSTFLRLFASRPADKIDIGIIKIGADIDIKLVQADIRAILPHDLLILTLNEFKEREIAYQTTDSPIGIIFGFGVAIGFLVGIVIVYQILYTDVSDHLPEYATLKAMGYSDAYLIGVLIQESLLLAAFGFVPGVLISTGLFAFLQSATLLPIAMKLSRATTVLLLTIVMCISSGLIAIRKLQQADPADIF